MNYIIGMNPYIENPMNKTNYNEFQKKYININNDLFENLNAFYIHPNDILMEQT